MYFNNKFYSNISTSICASSTGNRRNKNEIGLILRNEVRWCMICTCMWHSDVRGVGLTYRKKITEYGGSDHERLLFLFLDEGAVYWWYNIETLILCSLGRAVGECAMIWESVWSKDTGWIPILLLLAMISWCFAAPAMRVVLNTEVFVSPFLTTCWCSLTLHSRDWLTRLPNHQL